MRKLSRLLGVLLLGCAAGKAGAQGLSGDNRTGPPRINAYPPLGVPQTPAMDFPGGLPPGSPGIGMYPSPRTTWGEPITGLPPYGGTPGAGGAADTAPPAPAAGPVWENTVAGHEDYRRKVEQPPYDPEPWIPVHFSLSAGAYFFQPRVEDNTAFLAIQRQRTGGLTQVNSFIQDFSKEPQFGPRLTFAVETDSGLGLRTNWWHIDAPSPLLSFSNHDPSGNSLFQSAPAFGVPGFISPSGVGRSFGVVNDVLSFGSHLNLHVWDWEVTQEWHSGPWNLLLAGGVRYAYISQNYLAERFNAGNGRLGTSRVVIRQDSDVVQTGHNFSGAGPTGVVEVRYRLGDSGLSLYGTGRSSILFGRGRTHSLQVTVENRQIIPPRGSTQTVNTTQSLSPSKGHDDDLPIEDLELGLEWSHPSCHWVWWVRTGFAAQGWINAGTGSSEQGDVTFFGLALSAGVNF
jgi:hypothetical protein